MHLFFILSWNHLICLQFWLTFLDLCNRDCQIHYCRFIEELRNSAAWQMLNTKFIANGKVPRMLSSCWYGLTLTKNCFVMHLPLDSSSVPLDCSSIPTDGSTGHFETTSLRTQYQTYTIRFDQNLIRQYLLWISALFAVLFALSALSLTHLYYISFPYTRACTVNMSPLFWFG